jgi:hypothetical protein
MINYKMLIWVIEHCTLQEDPLQKLKEIKDSPTVIDMGSIPEVHQLLNTMIEILTKQESIGSSRGWNEMNDINIQNGIYL